MSEFVPNKGPNPLSGGLKEFINNSIIRAGRLNNHRLTAHYRDIERYERERLAIEGLCLHADRLLGLFGVNKHNQAIVHGDTRLSRRYDYSDPEQLIVTVFYTLHYTQNGEDIDLAWTNMSNHLDQIDKSEQHSESITEAHAHLHEAFA